MEIPWAYTKYNKSGMVAGILNVVTCVGNGIAGTVYGYTAEMFRRSKTIALWVVLVSPLREEREYVERE